EFSGTPGARISDELAIVNLGTQPVTLRLYATDATTSATGSFALLAANEKPTDIGTWIVLHSPATVHVPARTSRGPSAVFVPVTVNFPQNASPGDHAGGVVVSLSGVARNGQGVNVKLDQRVGMRVYARVAGPVHAALRIDNFHVGFAGPAIVGNPFGDGVATLHYTVRNVGNILLGAQQSATLSSWLGGSLHVSGATAAASSQSAKRGTLPLLESLLPGTSVTINQRVPGVFPGLRITATLHLTPLELAGAADPHVGPTAQSATAFGVPWSLIILVVVLLFGAGAAFWLIRRNRKRPSRSGNTSHRTPAVVARAGGDA
ncbi:MAG TPA: hypothetical protein VKB75_05630, partial [Jatrophihabitans sp.]|nr:hypothetical protein [Jatrophihabitans sp.]